MVIHWTKKTRLRNVHESELCMPCSFFRQTIQQAQEKRELILLMYELPTSALQALGMWLTKYITEIRKLRKIKSTNNKTTYFNKVHRKRTNSTACTRFRIELGLPRSCILHLGTVESSYYFEKILRIFL